MALTQSDREEIKRIMACCLQSQQSTLTLNGDQPTQDSLNLVGNELQAVPATNTTYGVVKLSDIGGPSFFARVDVFADLPDPALNVDVYYHVLNSSGLSWLPTWLGGSFYPKGIYYSDGVTWEYAGEVVFQATQATVNAGLNNDQFVTPATLAGTTQVVHQTGNESIAGTKTFTSDVVIPADPYSPSWNGVNEAAPKDAIHDKIVLIEADIIALAVAL